MAVPEQTPYIEHIANGISTQFSVPFQCLSKNTLIVSIDGVETLPQLWDFDSGEITFITAPLNNSTVSIKRMTSLKREVVYNSFSNSMLPTVFNGDFDRIWHVLQEYQFSLDNKVGVLRKISTSGNLQGGGSLEQNLNLFLIEQAVSANIAFGSSIKIPVITLNQDGTVKSLQEVDLIGGEGGAFRIAWGDVLNKPTTVGGYGITDTYTRSEANNAFIEDSEKGAAGGVATLAANSKIPVAQLPTATETAIGAAEIATQAETNAATDDARFVTPLKFLAGLKNHLNVSGNAPMYPCRAWVNFNGTGTPSIQASGNVSSITDNGTADYTVNFTTAMPNINYSFSQGCSNTGVGSGVVGVMESTNFPRTVSSFRFFAAVAINTAYEPAGVNLQFFR